MAKILVFGANSLTGIPSEVCQWIREYIEQGHTILVSDMKGFDTTLHYMLSRLGATKDNTIIYSMGTSSNNSFNFSNKVFGNSYDENNKAVTIFDCDTNEVLQVIEGVETPADAVSRSEWYQFRDKQLMRDCDMAIGVRDGSDKRAAQMFKFAGITDTKCYTFKI